MFNLANSVKTSNFYAYYFPFFSEFFLQLTNVFISLSILRNQVPEIKLLQLVPGYYFILIFAFLIGFFILVSLFLVYPSFLDNQKFFGSKAISKNFGIIGNKFSYFFYYISFFLSSNYVLPSNFDAFYFYSEKTVENFWSFDDLIKLEVVMIISLSFVSQIPLLNFFNFHNEQKIFQLSKRFKSVFFYSLLISGFLTPTVDASSQFVFSLFMFFAYIVSMQFLAKRISLKYLSLTFLT